MKAFEGIDSRAHTFCRDQKELKIPTGRLGISWTGQAGFSFKAADNFVCHVDPYLSDACTRTVGYRRQIPPPVEPAEMEGDLFLFTHAHLDHLDPDSIPEVAERNPAAVFAGPPSCVAKLHEIGIDECRLRLLGRGASWQTRSMDIHAVHAIHTGDSVGYVLKSGGMVVYVTGDTLYGDELLAVIRHRPNVMMCCINGRLGCMNIPDAVRLTTYLGPRYVIPMHYGMFQENTADPEDFICHFGTGNQATRGFIMETGKWYTYDLADGMRLYSTTEDE